MQKGGKWQSDGRGGKGCGGGGRSRGSNQVKLPPLEYGWEQHIKGDVGGRSGVYVTGEVERAEKKWSKCLWQDNKTCEKCKSRTVEYSERQKEEER